MPPFDKVKEFFIKRILIPNIFRIDIPGYLITRSYSVEGQKVAMRTVMVPEQFIINLENNVEKVMGRDGIEKIYAAGKGDGYYVSKITNFPKDEKTYSFLIPSFFGTLYAKSINLEVEKKNDNVLSIDLDIESPAASTSERFSYFFMGAWAGVWSYILEDANIECGIKSVSGNQFILMNAKPNYLKSVGIKTIVESNKILGNLDIYRYYTNNKLPLKLPADGITIKKLIDQQIFTYISGRLNLNKDKCGYLPLESFGLLQVEQDIPDEIVFESSYRYFFNLGQTFSDMKDPFRFMAQFLTALGFGIVEVIEITGNKRMAIFKGYPWFSEELSKTKAPFVRGAFSGFLSANLRRKIKSSFSSSKLENNVFILSINLDG